MSITLFKCMQLGSHQLPEADGQSMNFCLPHLEQPILMPEQPKVRIYLSKYWEHWPQSRMTEAAQHGGCCHYKQLITLSQESHSRCQQQLEPLKGARHIPTLQSSASTESFVVKGLAILVAQS